MVFLSINSSYYSYSSVEEYKLCNVLILFLFICCYDCEKGISSFCFLGGYCWYIRKALGFLDIDIAISLILNALIDFLWFSRYATISPALTSISGFTFLLILSRKPVYILGFFVLFFWLLLLICLLLCSRPSWVIVLELVCRW